MLTEQRRSYLRDEDGAVAIIVALILVVIFGFAALALDVGSAYNERRHLQTTADLAAISAAQNIPTAQVVATSTVQQNHDTADVESITFGHFVGDGDLSPSQRIQPRSQTSSDTNAVTVDLSSTTKTPFFGVALGQNEVSVQTTATAAVQQLTSFSLGSRVARFDPVLLNALLMSATGSSVNLTALDWQGLAGVNLTLASFLDALATQANINLDGYDDLANATVTTPQLVRALATVVGAQGSVGLQSRLVQVASSALSTQVPLSAIISLEDDVTDLVLADVLDRTEIDAFGLLKAVVDTGNEGKIINLPNLNLNIPGLTQLEGRIAVGEAKQNSGLVSVGQTGATVSTAQVRIFLRLTISPTLLGNLGTGVSVLSVRVPVYIEIAGASATLLSQNCKAEGTPQARATFSTALNSSGTPGGSVVRAFIGNFPGPDGGLTGAWPTQADFAPIVDIRINILFVISIPLVTIEGRAAVAVGQPALSQISFPGTASLPASRLYGSKNLVGTAVGSLLGNLTLRTSPASLVGGLLGPVLGLLTNVQQTLRPVLNTVVTPILDSVVDGLLDTLGLTLGEAELTLLEQRCRVDLVR